MTQFIHSKWIGLYLSDAPPFALSLFWSSFGTYPISKDDGLVRVLIKEAQDLQN
jgi:hypothetical protein